MRGRLCIPLAVVSSAIYVYLTYLPGHTPHNHTGPRLVYSLGYTYAFYVRLSPTIVGMASNRPRLLLSRRHRQVTLTPPCSLACASIVDKLNASPDVPRKLDSGPHVAENGYSTHVALHNAS